MCAKMLHTMWLLAFDMIESVRYEFRYIELGERDRENNNKDVVLDAIRSVHGKIVRE